MSKEELLARSALCRLQIHRHTHEVRRALQWKRVAVAVLPLALAGIAMTFARHVRSRTDKLFRNP